MKNYLYQDLYNLEESHWWHNAKRQIVLSLIKKYNKLKKPKILDIGCGTGKTLESLQNLGIVFGIDSSPQAIHFCKKRDLKNLSLEKSDHTHFPKESFDLITTLDVLEHTDDNKTLKEIYRILRKDGLLLITVPALPILWSKWDIALKHKRRYTKKSLKHLLEKNGFNILQISYMYSFLILPVIIIRTLKNIFFPKHYPSDFLLNFPIIDTILSNFAKLEAILIKKGIVPFGLSLITIVKKNESSFHID